MNDYIDDTETVAKFYNNLFNTCKYIDSIYSDMTVRQLIVIAAIAKHKDGVSMVDVALETGLASSIVSRTCRFFLSGGSNSKGFGFIEQFQDSADARRKSVRLTALGVEKLKAVVLK